MATAEREAARHSVPCDDPQCDHRAGAVLRPDRRSFAIGARMGEGARCGRVRRRARRLRRAHRAAASGPEPVRRRAGLAERQYRLRHRAGADPLPLVACRRRRGSAGSRRWRLRSAARLRLARFNARIDVDEQPHKSAGFNTGVPAPAGAGLAFVPIYLWLITGNDLFRRWELVMAWTLFIAAADDLAACRPTAGRRSASAAAGGCSRWPASRCSARR